MTCLVWDGVMLKMDNIESVTVDNIGDEDELSFATVSGERYIYNHDALGAVEGGMQDLLSEIAAHDGPDFYLVYLDTLAGAVALKIEKEGKGDEH